MKAEEKATKLADVAQALGLSVSTVSRALSGNGRVGKATCERVREYIESHDYRPNMLAKGLANGQTYNICAVLPSDAVTGQIPFFYECLMGICSVGMKENYSTVITTDRRGQTKHLEAALDANKADGYIVLRAADDDPAIKIIKESAYPLVVAGKLEDSSIAQVDEDNFGICSSFATDILKRGYKKPALILGNMSVNVNRARKAGFLAAVSATRPEYSEVIIEGVDTDEELQSALEALEKEAVDCIFCGDDSLCIRLSIILGESSAPKLASFYYNEMLAAAKIEAPKFDAKALGRRAAEKLISIMNS